jgi:hypothetical protein
LTAYNLDLTRFNPTGVKWIGCRHLQAAGVGIMDDHASFDQVGNDRVGKGGLPHSANELVNIEFKVQQVKQAIDHRRVVLPQCSG